MRERVVDARKKKGREAPFPLLTRSNGRKEAGR